MTFKGRPEEQSNPAGKQEFSQTTAEKEEERRKIRRLQLMIDMVALRS